MANTPIHHTFAGLVGRDARSHTNRAADLLSVLENIQKRLRAMPEPPADSDRKAFIADVTDALANAGLDTSPLPAWTVFVRQANDQGTTWVQAYREETVEQEKIAALNDAADAWGVDDTRDLTVLGVAEGDVNVVEWSD